LKESNKENIQEFSPLRPPVPEQHIYDELDKSLSPKH
jgi:hypothetical protein